ncbi:MAG: hypothetical protein SNJ67_08920 [Chloracidobacterium sp.]|uniref:Peptidase C-terminal archaeal/bacterial domain-containing protein n=1 Tax=Chloracidobacterium validum TaxID=2821543 RepID=A0ABX8B5Z5_9BACT|nr:hypothetical protein [Chloracidobacterium validum]QUW02343.1 hypothetical protein J8C06_08235 [Chloracidobacterium validum]
MRRQVLVGLGVSLAAAVAFPAFGQTARPTRIRFTPGASSTTVSGTLLPNRAGRKYVLRASAGQTLSFALSKTTPQVGAVVYDVDPDETGGAAPLEESVYQPVRTASVTLPKTGDYILIVSQISPPDRLRSSIKYSLTVEIR